MIPAAKVILQSDHADLDILLTDVQRSLAGYDLYNAHATLDLFWARLAVHIRAEHLRVFPALLRAKSDAEIDEIIKMLRKDHDFFMTELGRLVRLFRVAPDTDAVEVMTSARPKLAIIISRLKEHNKLEESRIYPLISELGETQSEHLVSGIKKELNNLPARFKVR